MSTNGIEPPPYRAKSARCCVVGCCRKTCPNGVLGSAASPNHSTGTKARYLLL
jgi:hypothetical protein